MKRKLVINGILVALVLLFALQNSEIVEIQLLVWRVTTPRSLLIFSMLAIGAVVGWFSRGMLGGGRKTES